MLSLISWNVVYVCLQLAMLVPLAYMSFCTYRSLTLLKIPFVKVTAWTS